METAKIIRLIILLLSLSVGAASARASDEAALKAGVFDPPRLAPDFTLPSSNGSPVRLSASRGKVVLLGFGYTSCTNVCPITLATLKQASRKLGVQAGDLQVIYVTVDPKRDTPAVMRKYLTAFDPRFIGGTGSEAQLAAVRKAYGITAMDVMAIKGSMGADGSMTHSSFIYLIDRKGRLRALMPFGRSADDYVHDLRILLASP